MNNNHSNNYFIKGIQAGDDKIIREFYQANFGKVAAFVSNNKGEIDDAKDVFQDGIMILFQQKTIGDIKTSLAQYFYGICRNIWYQKLRKRQKVSYNIIDQKDDFEINDAIEERNKYKLLAEKLSLLGDTCKKVIKLFFAKKTMVEIAEIMQLSSPEYAKKKKYKCKKELVKLIKSDRKFEELYK